MTRINLGINPARLIDQHLLAEYRELPRVFTLANKRILQGNSFDDLPSKFTLGEGHVKFFFNKLPVLQDRFDSICKELKRRQFNISYDWLAYPEGMKAYHICLYQNYEPTKQDRSIVRQRLCQVIDERIKQPRYCGKPISKTLAKKLLVRNVISTKWLESIN